MERTSPATAQIRRKLIAGNWKMNGLRAGLTELQSIIGNATPAIAAATDLLVCPPATLLHLAAHLALGSHVRIGAQNCHAATSGAFTGEISASMIGDLGATHVIVGHSERRTLFGETDAMVCAKAVAAQAAGLTPIVCVGETLEQREAGETLAVIERQIDRCVPDGGFEVVIAYEPVWAIGSGLTPSIADVETVHTAIRARLTHRPGLDAETVRILYGGSVKPSNAIELLGADEVDGALVGGASLNAVEFLGIARALLA